MTISLQSMELSTITVKQGSDISAENQRAKSPVKNVCATTEALQRKANQNHQPTDKMQKSQDGVINCFAFPMNTDRQAPFSKALHGFSLQ